MAECSDTALPRGSADAQAQPATGEQPTRKQQLAQLGRVVDQLCRVNEMLVRRADQVPCGEALPSLDEVGRCVEALRAALFPGYFGSSEVAPETLRYHLGHALDKLQRPLEQQIKRGLAFGCASHDHDECSHDCDARARRIIGEFLQLLPGLQQMLASDVRAAYEGDPAATSPGEAIFSYPGIQAVTNYRIAHALHRLSVPVLPRMITELAHSATGIDIHPGARIDECFFIDHGTGVVIGETCVIGKRVCIYQGVTLGAKSFPKDDSGNPIKGIDRHPIIEDGVIIYSGATILGRITIGAGSIIGGNVWLTRSLPPRSRITTQPARSDKFSHGGGI